MQEQINQKSEQRYQNSREREREREKKRELGGKKGEREKEMEKERECVSRESESGQPSCHFQNHIGTQLWDFGRRQSSFSVLHLFASLILAQKRSCQC